MAEPSVLTSLWLDQDDNTVFAEEKIALGT
jgi:hypothetical protein